MEGKKIAIIGGGISGLSAGIHALQRGNDVTLYEKQPVLGGLCTSWDRQGCEIDGCVHWLTGTSPTSSYYKHWQNVGVLGEGTVVYNPEYFTVVATLGESVTIWSDPDRLNAELKRVSPTDGALIDFFTDAVKAYKVFDNAPDKPDFMVGLPEKAVELFSLRSALKFMIAFLSQRLTEYAKKFKSPVLQQVMSRLMPGGYTVHYLVLTLNNYSRGNAGIPEGGSRKIIEKMQARYTELGGRLCLNAPVRYIHVVAGQVAGITLESGEDKFYDAVISCVDSRHLFEKLLGGTLPKEYEDRYADSLRFPTVSCILLSYAFSGSSAKECESFDAPPFKLGITEESSIYYRYYNYDKTIIKRAAVLEVMFVVGAAEAEYWESLRRHDFKAYAAEKKRLAASVTERLAAWLGTASGELELLDVATPATFNRYTNAYRGAYMSFVPSGLGGALPQTIKLKNIKYLYNGSQWAAMYGGAPNALVCGRLAAVALEAEKDS